MANHIYFSLTARRPAIANPDYKEGSFAPQEIAQPFDVSIIDKIKDANLPFIVVGKNFENIGNNQPDEETKILPMEIKVDTEWRKSFVMQGGNVLNEDIDKLVKFLPKGTIVTIWNRVECHGGVQSVYKVGYKNNLIELYTIDYDMDMYDEDLYVPDGYKKEHAWELTDEEKQEREIESSIRFLTDVLPKDVIEHKLAEFAEAEFYRLKQNERRLSKNEHKTEKLPF